MSSIITKQLMNSVTRNSTIFNIITYYYNGFLEKELSNLDEHNYYFILNKKYPVSKIDRFYPINANETNLQYDLILCNEPLANLRSAEHLGSQLHIPCVMYERSKPPSHMTKEDRLLHKKQLLKYEVIFPNDETAQAWQFKPGEYQTINYNYPSLTNKKERTCISNMYFYPEHLQKINAFKSLIPNMKSIGFHDNLEQEFSNCRYYISFAVTNDEPYDILKAMSAGAIIITGPHSETDKIIKSGENGYIFRDINDFISILRRLDGDEELRNTISSNAVKTIEERQHGNFSSFNDIFVKKAFEVYTK